MNPDLPSSHGTAESVLLAAKRYLRTGLSVVPIRADGTKAPALQTWKELQRRRMNEVEVERAFSGNVGVGLICGAVSGNMEVLDFDEPGFLDPWVELVGAEAPGLARRLVRVQTPGGGDHAYYRCSEVGGNQKLAQKPGGLDPKTRKPRIKTAIETRGEGGYVLAPGCPPSCHPNGKTYQLLSGSLENIPTITPAERTVLLRAARSFNRVPEHVEHGGHEVCHNDRANGLRPGDDYNRRATWEEILSPAGWTLVRMREDGADEWKRPGKNGEGISGTTGYCKNDRGGHLFYVFSTNAPPFESEHAYSKFAAMALLNHGGDFRAAARALAEIGYGDRRPLTTHPDTATSEAVTDGDGTEDEPVPVTLRLSEVRPLPIRWLWRDRIPLGKITVLDGDPGLGKTMLALDLAARVSKGREMPDNTRGDLGGPAGIIIMSAEDDPADTLRPRLDVAGGDLSRIVVLGGLVERVEVGRSKDGASIYRKRERLPTLADVEGIRCAVRDRGARLVIIDPLMGYLGGKDAHVDGDIRGLLAPIAKLAAEMGASVLLVRHLNKSGMGNPLYRGGGSIGIVAAARAGLLVAQDPDDEKGERRVLAVTKANLSEKAPSLAYRIAPVDGVARIEWLGPADHDAAALLRAPVDGEDRSSLDDATAFLRGALSYGPRPVKEVQKEGRAAGISERTLERAKARLRVRSGKGEFSGKWTWTLLEERQPATVPAVGGLGDLRQNDPEKPENGTSAEERQPHPLAALGKQAPSGPETGEYAKIAKGANSEEEAAACRYVTHQRTWHGLAGQRICAVCHPPPNGELVEGRE